MDFIFDVSSLTKEDDEFTDSKKDVLKYLKIIGVDTRFISYTPSKIYINNLRFSKFSKKRQETFNKQYPNIEVVRNSLFQKICSKSAKALSDIKPNSRVLVPKDNFMIDIILEPYTRKYGIKLVTDGEHEMLVQNGKTAQETCFHKPPRGEKQKKNINGKTANLCSKPQLRPSSVRSSLDSGGTDKKNQPT